MHTLIYALVRSTDEFEESPEELALETAKLAFDKLVGVGVDNTPVFDYYTTFDDSDSRVSGPARYGDMPAALKVDSEEGQQMLEKAWESTVSAFESNMERVRRQLDELTDEEIMNDVSNSRYLLNTTSRWKGSSVYLYNSHGQGITTERDLNYNLNNTDGLWIVPADAHF